METNSRISEQAHQNVEHMNRIVSERRSIVATVAAMTQAEARAAGWPTEFWHTARRVTGNAA